MTSKNEQINELLGVRDSYQAPEALMRILYDKERREKLFIEFLHLLNFDVTFDWFNEYFQDEHADRKKKKQDFTPQSVAKLLTGLVGDEGRDIYEGCAGTGGITIAKWDKDCKQHSPFDYKPSWYLYTCEELSDRALPFLSFNLLIRGMNSVVIHCDVLTRKAYGAFFIQNDYDDHLKFSSLNVFPYTETTAEELAVTWEEERYDSLIESEGIPKHVLEPTPYGEVSEFTKAIYMLAGVTE
ncbi:N-6 DNA methylase [Bacillus cereus]|uniref:N-6 DNA methylase n=1 Tax=Bacillus cereus TaxID=1396 RepID=UPI0025AF466E|nr:N-6 DNA methylase [Bacillus cereus]WJX07514.1 N-6 DNA methylase [Bacillus cereus]